VLAVLGYVTVALALAARQTSAGLCIRLGVWSASLGTLFALGVMAMLAMLPHIVDTFGGIFALLMGIDIDAPLEPMGFNISMGFGIFALEATVLMILAPVAVGVLRLPRTLQVAIGLLLMILALGRVAWWAAG